VLLALVLASIRPAFGLGVYWSPRIEGTILNASTKAPVEGVTVTATWIEIGIMGHGEVTLNVAETETDAQGEYTLPAWGPRFYGATLREDQPVIRFFKPGYVPLIIRNNSAYHPGLENDTEHMIKVPVTLSDGSTGYRLYEPEEHRVAFGKKRSTFLLVPFEGTDADYVKLLRGPANYIRSLSHIYVGDDCEWKKLPKTFVELHRLRVALEAKGVTASGLPYVSSVGGQDHCGNAQEYFKRFLNEADVR
jgi:hypothetical protein